MLREKQTAFVSQFFAPNTLLNDFRPDQDGNVAIIFCLMATVLMLAVGAAVDVGRWLHARDQTVAAVDAALLAGGRALQANATDEGAAIAAAQQFYTQNTAFRWSATQSALPSATTGSRWSRMARRTSRLCFCR